MTDLGYKRIARNHDLGECWEKVNETVSNICASCASEMLHADTHHMTHDCDWERPPCDFCDEVQP